MNREPSLNIKLRREICIVWNPFFKLSELNMLYVSRLEDLGIDKAINKTRLKLQLLEHFPDAQEQSDGKKRLLLFLRKA